jgi:hypothetical protein
VHLRRIASTLAAIVAAAPIVAIAGSPAQAALPYCNTISTVKSTNGINEILYPGYKLLPFDTNVAPTLSCDMARINEDPTSQERQAIIQIQKTLKLCYGKSITVDGLYGNGTRQAVREVQQSLGLTVDGWAGPNTRGAMLHMQQGSSTPCMKRLGTGTLSNDHWKWYMYYPTTSASQPSQVFSPLPTITRSDDVTSNYAPTDVSTFNYAQYQDLRGWIKGTRDSTRTVMTIEWGWGLLHEAPLGQFGHALSDSSFGAKIIDCSTGQESFVQQQSYSGGGVYGDSASFVTFASTSSSKQYRVKLIGAGQVFRNGPTPFDPELWGIVLTTFSFVPPGPNLLTPPEGIIPFIAETDCF